MLARLAPDAEERLREMAGGVAPGFAELTTELAFGGVLARPGLELRDRQIATIAMLAALGHERQLAAHIRYGLNVGLSREEVVEVLIQVAVYAGWPAALNALGVAADVLPETP